VRIGKTPPSATKKKMGQNAKVLLALKTLAGVRLLKNSCETAGRVLA
jgi:hypothetical protein